ncbi:MAG: hypothetical protein H0T73_22660 [Ardenticatenales bacterium]|nr:hypothetical protein [Ardenticatenales bacterium]
MSRFWKVLGYGVVGFFVCFLIIAVLTILNPYKYSPWEVQFNFNKIREELPTVKAQWQSLGVEDYDVEVSLSGICVLTLTLEVRNTSLSRVIKHEAPMATGWRDRSPWCPSTGDLTVSGMFDMVEHKSNSLDSSEDFMFVKFDPEFGYVREYWAGMNHPGVSECCISITYHNFRPISP